MIRDCIVRTAVTTCIACIVAAVTGCVDGPVAVDDEPYAPDSAGVVLLDTAKFAEMVEVDGRVAMVDFFSPLCPACRAMDTVVANLAARFEGRAVIGKVNADEDDSLSSRFNITWLPTFVFLKGGVEYEQVTGIVSGDSLAAVLERGLSGGVSKKAPSMKQMLEIPATVEACRVIRKE